MDPLFISLCLVIIQLWYYVIHHSFPILYFMVLKLMVKDCWSILQEWEITAASEKLAECQETILNLGKQLKAMASPREAALFDKVITNPTDVNTTTAIATGPTSHKTMSRRSSLLDQMLAEDGTTTKDLMFPKTKEVDSDSTSTFGPKRVVEPLENILNLNLKYCAPREDDNASTGSFALVPSKKRGGGSLWRRLLWRKKKGNSKKAPLPIALW